MKVDEVFAFLKPSIEKLTDVEKKELCKFITETRSAIPQAAKIEKPIPPVKKTPYLNGWKGLSEYLDNTPVRNLHEFEKRGMIKKYKLGKKVFFKKEEVDKALILVK